MTIYKNRLAQLAYEEASLRLKGNSQKAGHEIEKFLSPFRPVLGKSDARYMDIDFGADWCAAFVYYVVVKAGYKLNVCPFANNKGTFALVGIWYEWALLEGKFKERSYEPEPGDLVLYDRLVSDLALDHIGVVLESHDRYLLAAEGNVNNMTGLFERQKNDKIRGYISL